jgi:hypothetical protein
VLPKGAPAVPEYYQRSLYWPPASLRRIDELRAKIAAANAG